MKKIIFLILFFILFLFLFSQNYNNYKILIIDKDRDTGFYDPYSSKYIGYEKYWINSLNQLGFSTDSNNLEIRISIPPIETLLSYAVTIVECGHLGTGDIPISSYEFDLLSDYMDNGGCVYMEGNNLAEYMYLIGYDDFLNYYFNLRLNSNGNTYSYFDTIKTDTTNTFFHDFFFFYPAESPPDSENDEIVAADPADSGWQSVIIANTKLPKLYKTTASAYAPPVKKDNKFTPWRSYFSVIDMGALYVDTRQTKSKYLVSDSIAAEIERTAYVRDILRFFGIGLTLIVNDADDNYDRIVRLVDYMGKTDYDYIVVHPGYDGPNYNTLLKYESVIWYTGLETQYTISITDKDNLMTYMDFGGNLLLSGENIGEELGYRGAGETDDTFLYYYMGVDYIEPLDTVYPYEHISDINGEFYKYIPYEPLLMNYTESADIISPAITLPAKPAFIFRSSLKAYSYSGVTYNEGSHNSIFLSFPLEQEKSDSNIIDLINRTFDLFGYDFTFKPNDITTSSNSINISYNQFASYILFHLNIENPKTGKIELYNHNTLENSINTNINEKTYKISSKTNSGIFKLIYKDNNNKILFSQKIKIVPFNENNNIYIRNNILYINIDNTSKLSIYDITGKLQYSKTLYKGTNIINKFQYFNSGIYFIKIDNSIKKILKY